VRRRPPSFTGAGVYERRAWRYSCRGVDAVLEGGAFAGVFLYVLSTRPCSQLSYRTRCALWTSSALSLLSAASSLLEVDCSTSEVLTACVQRKGVRMALLHLLFRTTEIASRLLVLGALAVLFAAAQSAHLLPALLLADYFATALSLLSLGGCEWLAPVVALPAVAGNVVRFVDAPAWVPKARKVTACLRTVRSVELAAVLGGVVLALSGEWSSVFGTPSPFRVWGDDNSLEDLTWDNLAVLLEARFAVPLAGVVCLVLHLFLALCLRRCLALQAQADGLHRAATRGDVDRLSMLLFCRGGGPGPLADRIDQSNEEGLTPLHVAAQLGQARAVAVLLRARAEVTATAPNGETAVMLAAVAGRDEALRHLLLHGGAATLAATCSPTGDTALHLAVSAGRSACVHTLVRARADPAARNEQGLRALEMEAESRGAGAVPAPAAAARTVGMLSYIGDEGLDTPDSIPSQSSQLGSSQLRARVGSDVLAINSAEDSDLDAMLAEAPAGSVTRSAFINSSITMYRSQLVSSMARSGASSTHCVVRTAPRRASLQGPAPPKPSGLSSLVALAGPGALYRLALPRPGWEARALAAEVRRATRLRRPKPGASLLDCFQIVRLIGEGNFGTVYEARDMRERELRGEAVERRCALKILHRQKYRVEDMMIRARQERQVLKAARHPFIVQLLCAFRTPIHELALVMEFCPNGDLNELVVRRGSPGLEESLARRLLAEVLLALQYLHEELDVVFRDLKPENVVLDGGMHAKLTDFGLVKVNVTAEAGALSFVGSTSYVAPEVSAYGCEPYGKAVDLYALGLVSWVCFTGGIRVAVTPRDTGAERALTERAEPPPSHESLQVWLRAVQASGGSTDPGGFLQVPPQALRGLPPATGLSEHAFAFVATLTSRKPAARGTASSLRLHPFFAESGLEPPLASRDNWAALLPSLDEPSTPTSTGSTDSWMWDPSWRPRRRDGAD